MRLILDDKKTGTTLEIIDQIHGLILEGHWISTKSISEQLGISRERVGSIIQEDLDMRMLSAKWAWNAWTWIKNVNGASPLSKFGKFFGAVQMITCREWWS